MIAFNEGAGGGRAHKNHTPGRCGGGGPDTGRETRATRPEWITAELVAMTIGVFRPRYARVGRMLSEAQAVEILINAGRLGELGVVVDVCG